ncbi:MAG TPA: tRNA pseudouridine(38-40) synthase TruA [Patescibacteria group bacterium]|nr:tRNA pseudouridine(38-40) synthase TruA [Patescibacteria group bacterium]
MTERNLKLTVAYDGTAYHGFQRQANAQAIQQVLEEKLAKVFGHPLKTIGAGRTDTGVHARGQVINFLTSSVIPAERIPMASRGELPDDIVVMQAEDADVNFHARFDAKSKIYRYRILNAVSPDPLLRRYAWNYRRPLDALAMNEAAAVLVGTHDFSAFRSVNGQPLDPVRTIFAVRCERTRPQIIECVFWGSGFLYHMVRNLVGTLVQVGLGQISVLEFQQILMGRDRQQAAATAPPQGLCLEQVQYEKMEIKPEVIRKVLDIGH